MKQRFLVFKSVRGLNRPWLVFTPSERTKPDERLWDMGFATWHDAMEAIASGEISWSR